MMKIILFLFTSSSKKLIFLFILLLLLPFAGCKSVVKETVIEEPVRIVYPTGLGFSPNFFVINIKLVNGRMGKNGTPNILKRMDPFSGALRTVRGLEGGV